MHRNFILPSENMNYTVHDCRTDEIKFKRRSKLYDVSVLSTVLSKTKKSLNSILYENYLTQPEEDSKNLSSSPPKSSLSLSNNTNNKSHDDADYFSGLKTQENNENMKSVNKLIRERIVNCDDKSFGNLIWPKSIVTTLNNQIICADAFEHRLLIFNRDFIFNYQIGCRGSEKGQFNEPVDVALGESGLLFVADKNNYRIQVFNEQEKYKKLRAQISRLLFSGADDESRRSDLERPGSFKTGSEFTFNDQISLKQKPLKLSSAPLASTLAVLTENSCIFILNDKNQIVNFLKLKEENLSNNKRFCLNGLGNELIILSSKSNEAFLKFYAIEQQELNNSTESLINYDSSDKNDSTAQSKDTIQRKETCQIKKMNFICKKKLERIYFPGIALQKIGFIKLSLDLRSLFIYDQQNLALLEYDLSGEFKRVLLKAENHLGNVLCLDFSSDRHHLVTAECELLAKKVDLTAPSLFELFENKEPFKSEHTSQLEKRSKMFTFKLKTFRHADCSCHKHLNRKSRLRSQSPAKDSLSQSRDNQSSFGFYNINS